MDSPSNSPGGGDSVAALESTVDAAGATGSFLRKVAGSDDSESGPTDVGDDEAIVGPSASRFEIRRRLGAGGFGTVYEALDRERNARVALKSLTRQEPRAIYRFKQEFRTLADISHPNLVQLYELHGDGERWFFTMELVHGQDLQSHVKRASPGRAFDEIRLRAALRQLASGLCFLHEAGKLHRDIKPSNVMVDRSGRVVLLDFGLVVDLTPEGALSALGVAGTPLYMAPEQAAGDPIGPSADWYAVGVLLYQALTDRLPFEGSAMELMSLKLTASPPPPSQRAPGVPEDLDRLCMDLLRRQPAERPSGQDVLERLARHEDKRPSDAPAPAPPVETGSKASAVLVGRAAHLAQLHEAFQAVRAGRTAAALVHGSSGMGKSALVARFLEDLRASEPDAVVLRGRCYEQESVPYEALDSLVDALGRHLLRMSPVQIAAVLPRDAAALSRMFPALRRVAAVATARRKTGPADEIALRRRAVGALRELFGRMGDRAPLVLFVDDLQWGDADGGALMAELLRPPDAPAMLVIVAYHTDEADQSECLRALLPAVRAAAGPALRLRDIEVGALGDADARYLALAQLAKDRADPPSPERALAIARESGGWPFFIRELCRADGAAEEARPSLEGMLRSRIAALSPGARRLLEAVAVAGRPIRRAAALQAAELGDGGPAALALLRKQRFVRVHGDRTKDEVAPYHDRIRETVAEALLPEEKRTLHLRLASALEEAGRADAETLAVHFLAAGETAKAADHLVKAADQAFRALGFGRAARLYQQAIASIGEADPRRRGLFEKLGASLGKVGRGPEAAAAYLAAAEGAAASQALELRSRAAHHYLISGRGDDGIEVLRTVLAATGLAMPESQIGVLVRLLFLLVILRLRGLGFRERSEDAIESAELLRVDACAAVSFGMIAARTLTAVYFHKRFLLLALRAGEPYRVLSALTFDARMADAGGGDTPSAAARRVEAALHPLVERLRGSGARFRELEPALDIGEGVAAMFRGRFRESREVLERALPRHATSGARLGNGAALGSAMLLGALFCLGEWREHARRHREMLEDARARGDLFLEIELSKSGHLGALMEDRPDAAREIVNRVETLFTRTDQSRRYARAPALGETALYEDAGIGASALALVNEAWASIARSGMLFFSSIIRLEYLHLRGRAHLAAAASAPSSERAAHLRAALRDARATERIPIRVGAAYRAILRAGAAAAEGDRARARELLAEAESIYVRAEMVMHAAICRRRLGELAGGDEARDRIASADAFMRAQGVQNPARMTSMFLPGNW